MDGVKQEKNKCTLCEHVFRGGAMRIQLHFLQVPGCVAAKCTAAEDTWVDVDEDKEGEEEEGQQEGWFIGKEEDVKSPQHAVPPCSRK
eukprot:scaffold35659_cov21-Tisochrysis_lutea.AAC.1